MLEHRSMVEQFLGEALRDCADQLRATKKTYGAEASAAGKFWLGGGMHVSFGSPFSAVSKPMFASKYSFCSIFLDLQVLHIFTPLQVQTFTKTSNQMFGIQFTLDFCKFATTRKTFLFLFLFFNLSPTRLGARLALLLRHFCSSLPRQGCWFRWCRDFAKFQILQKILDSGQIKVKCYVKCTVYYYSNLK